MLEDVSASYFAEERGAAHEDKEKLGGSGPNSKNIPLDGLSILWKMMIFIICV